MIEGSAAHQALTVVTGQVLVMRCEKVHHLQVHLYVCVGSCHIFVHAQEHIAYYGILISGCSVEPLQTLYIYALAIADMHSEVKR